MRSKLLAVSCATLLLAAGTTAFDTSNGALVINPAGDCTMFNGDGGFEVVSNTMAVITPSANGMFRCQGDVANSTGTAQVFNSDDNPFFPGLPCGIAGAGFTTNWTNTVSASGRATLSCRLN